MPRYLRPKTPHPAVEAPVLALRREGPAFYARYVERGQRTAVFGATVRQYEDAVKGAECPAERYARFQLTALAGGADADAVLAWHDRIGTELRAVIARKRGTPVIPLHVAHIRETEHDAALDVLQARCADVSRAEDADLHAIVERGPAAAGAMLDYVDAARAELAHREEMRATAHGRLYSMGGGR